MNKIDDRPTSVYQYFNEAGELLYVGVTARGVMRGHEHERTKAWWPLVASSTVKHYPTRTEALIQEAYLISYWRPPHNVQGRPEGPPRKRGDCSRPADMAVCYPLTRSKDGEVPVQEARALLGRLGRVSSLREIDLGLLHSQLVRVVITANPDTGLTDVRRILADAIKEVAPTKKSAAAFRQLWPPDASRELRRALGRCSTVDEVYAVLAIVTPVLAPVENEVTA